MAKLSASERKALPQSTFGEPAKRAYPMPDKNHARLAKSGASRAQHVGNISKAQEQAIDRKADRILGKANGGVISGPIAAPIKPAPMQQGYQAMGSAKSASKRRGY